MKIEIGEKIVVFRMNDKYTASDFFINPHISIHRLGDRNYINNLENDVLKSFRIADM